MNTITKLPVLNILLLCSTFAIAQQATLSGLVTDSVGNFSLPGVNITVDANTGVATDAKGKYELTLEPGEYKVQFSMIGYTKQTKHITLRSGELKNLDVRLKPSATELNTMVVSAGRFEQRLDEVTVSMEVIKPKLIENTNATSMETVIEQVPGLTVTDGQANVRGGSGYSYGTGSRVLLMVDGLPLLAGDAGDVKWSFLPVENIDQVEIIKGASSALFGSSALNGVINVRTAYPTDKPQMKMTVFHGFYDTPARKELRWWKGTPPLFSGNTFKYSEKFNNFDLVIGSATLFDDGYRQSEDENRVRFNVNTRYRFSTMPGLAIGLNGNVQRNKGANFLIWGNSSDSAYIPLNGTVSHITTDRYNIDPYITYTAANGSNHKLRARYFKTNNMNDSDQASVSGNLTAEYVYQQQLLKYFTVTGGMARQGITVSGELFGKHNSSSHALFAQADFKYKKWSVAAGARLETNVIDDIEEDTRPVYRSGVNYKLAEFTSLRASYGEGYRFPSVAEKFIRTNVGSFYIYPNDSIQPETGWSAEFGVKQGWKLGKVHGYVDVAAFWTEYKDMMEFTFRQWGNPFVDPFFGLGFKSINIGNTRITGLDASITATGDVAGWQIDWLAGYTYIDPIQLDFDAAIDTLSNSANYNILKYRYKHMVKSDVNVEKKKFSMGFSSRYNSFMENVDLVFLNPLFLKGVADYRKTHNKGDVVFDARAGYRLHPNTRLSLISKNVLNREYMGRPADMQPMRSFVAQLMIDL